MPVLHKFVNPIADEPGFLGTKPSDWNDGHSISIVDADVDVAAGIQESKLSLSFPTHAALTLGAVPSGLSLAGQVLSLGLASSGVTGALSGTDWDTFNGKQSTLTFPLASTLGGTGINNAGTLTNASNTTITGGGTLALGGFTLTVPATGTAALLATANVFSANQRINATLGINAAPPTTSNLYSVHSSSGVSTFGLRSYNAIGSSAHSGNAALYFENYAVHASGLLSTTYGVFGYNIASMSGTGTLLSPSSIYGVMRQASANAITGNMSGMRSYILQDASSGTITSASCFIAQLSNGASATLTTWEGYGFDTLVKNGTITNAYGIRIPDITIGGTVNNAIKTAKGLNVFGDQLSITGWQDVNQLIVTGFTTQTLPLAHLIDNTATTNAIRNVLQLEARSTGTAAAGLGVGIPFYLETATNGTYQQAALIAAITKDATNVSRKYTLQFSAYDTAARLGLEIEASGTVVQLGFFGVATVVRPTALTAQLTTITHTAPGTPDYAIQDMTNITPYGFATQDEGNTVLSVIKNLQTRVGELETKLQALGLLT